MNLLSDSLRTVTHVDFFDWRTALLGKYEVLHVHWPESFLRAPTRSKRVARRLALRLLVLRAQRRRIAVVLTRHNLEPHDARLSLADRRRIQRLESQSSHWIVLNRHTPVPSGVLATVIPHGHYRDHVPEKARAVRPQEAPVELLYFGLVRAYKGLDSLIPAFAELPPALGVELTVVGRAPDAAAGREVEDFARDIPRLHVQLEHVPDAKLSGLVAQTDAVVLPYKNMHNSGAALLALSLNCPVIVPRNPVTDDLRTEFGDNFIYQFDGEIDTEQLQLVTRQVAADRALRAGKRVSMTGRDWRSIANEHLAVYRSAAAQNCKT